MELKKYFHDKILVNLITLLIGALLVSVVIATQTVELNVLGTYAFLFVIFSFGYQAIKSTVRKARRERYKLNKEWALLMLGVALTIMLAIVTFYTLVPFYRYVGAFLLALIMGANYCMYRFVYLTKIFQLKEVQQEVLYFSWKLWGTMLDRGAKEEDIAQLIVDSQVKCNSRLNTNSWGARFSRNKVANVPVGESGITSDNVGVSVMEQLTKSALDIVATYEKKK